MNTFLSIVVRWLENNIAGERNAVKRGLFIAVLIFVFCVSAGVIYVKWATRNP